MGVYGLGGDFHLYSSCNYGVDNEIHEHHTVPDRSSAGRNEGPDINRIPSKSTCQQVIQELWHVTKAVDCVANYYQTKD